MESLPKAQNEIPKLGKNRLPKKPSNMDKQEILEAIKRKRECNMKSLKIVEKLLEPVKSDELILHLKDINQCHYQDIVEERAIIKLCGYPLCKKPLKEIPKKQFHISTISNKVFDITERKNFCSNNCYKASNYIKDQMLTSPLWLRDQEDIPEFKLLSFDQEDIPEFKLLSLD